MSALRERVFNHELAPASAALDGLEMPHLHLSVNQSDECFAVSFRLVL